MPGSIQRMKRLPSIEEMRQQYPITHAGSIDAHREAIMKIIDGRDTRKMLIVGPCSAWPDTADSLSQSS